MKDKSRDCGILPRCVAGLHVTDALRRTTSWHSPLLAQPVLTKHLRQSLRSTGERSGRRFFFPSYSEDEKAQ